ncbi:hypothetical protein GLOIN_2v1569746 [Rhizophagus clarus]|uniref:Uncharacterized protein n=1 Tax=Rhizophagus clarus TaxID=94130 RepID=A0A8H3QVG2_9GLOM|nr:hypothetical protein GLOIN_2v1569746 [Rhizophagus clarus]
MFSLTIIRKELKFSVFLIYGALIAQEIIGIVLLGLTFINTILCHRNFGKNLALHLNFNPILDKEYEYSNDLDDDDDDDEEKDEKDEMIFEILYRFCIFFKQSFYDAFILLYNRCWE